MNTPSQRYTELPIGDRAAFELVCARHGFAPAHFDVSSDTDPDDAAHGQMVTVRRGRWAQCYRVDRTGHWVHEFETDLTCRFFK